ncbi:hypothetical protein P8452_40370 [Trifolium repens]|nr:hypothetical protein P8452_40370 [Trifolium repens]
MKWNDSKGTANRATKRLMPQHWLGENIFHHFTEPYANIIATSTLRRFNSPLPSSDPKNAPLKLKLKYEKEIVHHCVNPKGLLPLHRSPWIEPYKYLLKVSILYLCNKSSLENSDIRKSILRVVTNSMKH